MIKGFLIYFITALALRYIYRKTRGLPTENKSGEKVLRLSGIFAGLGVVSILFGLFFVWMWVSPASVGFNNDIPKDPDDLNIMLMMSGGAFVMGILLILYRIVYKVEFNDSGIKYRNLFGIERYILWEDVKEVFYGQVSHYLMFTDTKGKKISVSLHTTGFEAFTDFMKKKLPEEIYSEAIQKAESVSGNILGKD